MNKTKNAAFTALCAALLGLLSQIALPLPSGMPLTLQTFAVALVPLLLGPAMGTCAVAVWLILGAVGIPLFSGFRGGISVLLGPTGGFLMGFLLLALLCGAGRNRALPGFLLLAVPGLILCHLCGIFWFSLTAKTYLSTAALTVSLPYLPKDLIFVILAYLCAAPLRRKLPLGEK